MIQNFASTAEKQKTSEPKKSGILKCQKCLKYGHWTYECKSEPVYLYRPSRTLQYKEPHLKQALNNDKAPKGPKITDGDRMRTVQKEVNSESDEKISLSSDNESSSSDSSSDNSSSSGSSSSNSSSSNAKEKKTKKIQKKIQKSRSRSLSKEKIKKKK